jgi:hypothetical protein
MRAPMSLLDRIQTGREISFVEFWQEYLHAHSKPGTRAVHYPATMAGIASATSLSSGLTALAFEPGGRRCGVAGVVCLGHPRHEKRVTNGEDGWPEKYAD